MGYVMGGLSLITFHPIFPGTPTIIGVPSITTIENISLLGTEIIFLILSVTISLYIPAKKWAIMGIAVVSIISVDHSVIYLSNMVENVAGLLLVFVAIGPIYRSATIIWNRLEEKNIWALLYRFLIRRRCQESIIKKRLYKGDVNR